VSIHLAHKPKDLTDENKRDFPYTVELYASFSFNLLLAELRKIDASVFLYKQREKKVGDKELAVTHAM
jgi:hypothetical protein